MEDKQIKFSPLEKSIGVIILFIGLPAAGFYAGNSFVNFQHSYEQQQIDVNNLKSRVTELEKKYFQEYKQVKNQDMNRGI